ncbi:MAG TPA: hypothetical protein VNE63_05780 [Candidatus Acidoferrales bacterium]|nr:hypothetical protein [Candidatus Acidoferrales bacterium]
MTAQNSENKCWHPVWAAAIVIAVVAVGLSVPPGRSLGRRFFDSLRIQKVQAVNVDLSNFVGPNANPTLQQMVSQMISDRVDVTVNEKDQPASDGKSASQLAGFPAQLLGKRNDAPHLMVGGQHAFQLTVDLARLQAIVKEAGRSDLVLPQSINGAVVAVQIPRTVRAQYGDCPGPASAAANIATPPPSSTQYSDCVILSEGPSPVVNVPVGLDVEQLAQIGLELAGMSPSQAHQFLQTVNWKSTLGVSIPRFMRSYQIVKVDGVNGTLLDMAGRRGPSYALIWTKNGMAYSLTGFGDSSSALPLADSLK